MSLRWGQRWWQQVVAAMAWAILAQVVPGRPAMAAERAVQAGVVRAGFKMASCPPAVADASALGTDLALGPDEVLDQAWRCTDLDGDHLVTVSRSRNPGQRGIEMLFAMRSRHGSTWRKDWQARDFVLAPFAPGLGSRHRVELKDADGDGHIEVYIGYVLPGPSQSVDEGKLLVFSNGRKYAIRGAIPRTPDDFGSRQIGSAFHDLPSPVQDQALRLWDQLSRSGARSGGERPSKP